MKKFSLFMLLWFFATIIFAQTSPNKYLIKYLESNTPQPDYGVTFLNDNQFVFKSPSTEKINLDSKKLSVSNLFIATIGEEGDIIEKKQIQGFPTNKVTKTGAAYSKDLKTVYFSAMKYRKKRKRNDKEQLFKADVDVDGNWSNMVKLPFSNIKYSFGEPALSPDGKELYFTSDMPSTIGGADIFVVDIHEDGSFGEPKNLGPTINTSGNEVTAYISKENILYFSSDGHPNGLGGLDVYVSNIKSTPTKPFHLDAPINSASDDFSFITSNDKRGYFASNRLQGENNHDIYSFLIEEIIKDEKCIQEIVGIVKDKENEQAIEGASITLFDNENNELKQVKTDEKGAYKFVLDCNKTYTLKASGELYSIEEHIVNTANYLKAPTLEANKFLVKKSAAEIANTETVIAKADDVKNTVTKEEDEQSNVIGETVVEEVATVNSAIDNSIDKDKEELVDVVIETSVTVEEEKEEIITTDEKVIEEIVDNNDTTEEDEATLNPVYFGFDKFNISAKSAKELDKIAKVLNNNNNIHIEVSSYTDSRGSYAYNLKLSERRAKASADYLVALGIDRSRITTKGLGESKMVNKCIEGIECSEAAHEKNRRTEFAFLNPQAAIETSSNYESKAIKKEEIQEVSVSEVKKEVSSNKSFSDTKNNQNTIVETETEISDSIIIEDISAVDDKRIVDNIANTYADIEESSDESFSGIENNQLSSTNSKTKTATSVDKIEGSTEDKIDETTQSKKENNLSTDGFSVSESKVFGKEETNEITEKIEVKKSNEIKSNIANSNTLTDTIEASSEQKAFNELITEAEVEREQEENTNIVKSSNNVDNSVPNKLLAEIKSQIVQPTTKPVKAESIVSEKPAKSSVKDETTIVANTVTIKAMQSKKGKYIETTKSKRVHALRVSFRLQQNYLATKGYKDAYVVIQKQDGKTINEKGVFTLANGKEKAYTDETTVYYNNQSMKVVMFVDKIVHKFSKGVYLIDIYVEGHLVGSNTLRLVS